MEKKLTIRIKKDLHKKFKLLCITEGTSMQKQIEQFIQKIVDQKEVDQKE